VWSVVIDTADPYADPRPLDASRPVAVPARSVVVLRGEQAGAPSPA